MPCSRAQARSCGLLEKPSQKVRPKSSGLGISLGRTGYSQQPSRSARFTKNRGNIP